ncbi:MAG: hypothetical protein AB8B83_00505 [Bdellovibrionales bacterium]
MSGVCVENAHAQWSANVPATCDPGFADVIEARSYMEASREIEMAQTLILKPDSVLEYSCFNNRLAELNAADNIMFTGNLLPGSPLFQDPVLEYTPPGTPYSMFLPTIDASAVDQANFLGGAGVLFGPQAPGAVAITPDLLGNILGILVTDSLFQFVYDNFGHTYGGGTFSGLTGGICAPMQAVWQFSKCVNAGNSWFRRFNEYTLGDFRTRPIPCNIASRNTFWPTAIAASNPDPGNPGGVTPMNTQATQLDSSACSSVTPVPTGVVVYHGSPLAEQSYEDAVCLAAGCYFDGTSCQ